MISRRAHRSSILVDNERQMYKKTRSERYGMGVKADRNLRSEHMIVSAQMPDFAGDMRPVRVEQRRVSSRAARMAPRRHQELSAVKLVDWPGMRASAAVWLMVALLAFLGTATLVHEAGINEAVRKNNQLSKDLRDMQTVTEQLRVKYAAATADVEQALLAKEHGYISAKGTEQLSLFAPDNAVFGIGDVPPKLPGESLATILGE